MTDARDDLVERLQSAARDLEALFLLEGKNSQGPTLVRHAREAATRIQQLTARVEELEADNATMKERVGDHKFQRKAIAFLKQYNDDKASLAEAERVIEATCEAFYEISNRAANMMDQDAADWLPSIYRIACDACGENPLPMLRAAGFAPEELTVSMGDTGARAWLDSRRKEQTCKTL
jgi:hypothetical protein